jgi:hypothetical protein
VTGPAVHLIAVSGPWPGGHEPDVNGFRDLVLSAQAVERRRERGYHLAPEDLRRFTAACAGIERLARLHGRTLASFDATALRQLDSQIPRAQAGFHPPGDAALWLRALARVLPGDARTQAGEFATAITATGEGLILSPALTPAKRHWDGVPLPPLLASARIPQEPLAAAELRAASPHWPAFAADDGRARSASALWDECAARLADGRPLLVGSGARHEVITEVFNHAGAHLSSMAALGIFYVDGSLAQPFPLQRPRVDRNADGRTLRVGLMSMRHTEIDTRVDGYWFRNRLVSTTRTLAETDAFCAAVTEARLTALNTAGIDRIELVHTGFEPAAIGFYRGVLQYLASADHAPVHIQPVYLIRKQYAHGTAWGAA